MGFLKIAHNHFLMLHTPSQPPPPLTNL